MNHPAVALRYWLAAGLAFALADLAVYEALGWSRLAADLHWDIAVQWGRTGVFGYRPGESTVVRGPTFIAGLVPFSWLSGGALWGGVVAVTLARAAGGYLVARLARRVTVEPAATAAGLAWFLHPVAVHYDNCIGSESASALLLLGCVMSLLRWRDQPSALRAAAFGALCALAVLAKTTLATFVLGFGAVVAVAALGQAVIPRARIAAHAAVAVVAAAACVAPWTLRNHLATGKPYLVQAHFRANMVFGNALFDHELVPDYDLNGPFSREVEAMYDWAETTQGFAYAAHEHVGEQHLRAQIDPSLRNPGYLARKIVRTGPRLWYLGTSAHHTRSILAVMLPLYALAAVGAWRLARRSRDGREFVAAVGCGLLAATVGHGAVLAMFRYSVPFQPALCVLAGVALGDGWQAWRLRRSRAEAGAPSGA